MACGKWGFRFGSSQDVIRLPLLVGGWAFQNIVIETRRRWWLLPGKAVIFHDYLTLPECTFFFGGGGGMGPKMRKHTSWYTHIKDDKNFRKIFKIPICMGNHWKVQVPQKIVWCFQCLIPSVAAHRACNSVETGANFIATASSKTLTISNPSLPNTLWGSRIGVWNPQTHPEKARGGGPFTPQKVLEDFGRLG